MNSLYVHVDLGDGTIVLAGQLKLDFQSRRGGFKYARSYCRHPEAYPLDPINLPLSETAVYESPITRDHFGIPGALMDAGPDLWGKRVLIALFNPPPSNDIEFLLAGSGMGVGSLYFTTHKNDIPTPPPPSEFTSIEDILETALLIEQGLEVDREKAMFFHHGSSLGGARPKTFIDQREADPATGESVLRRWIVKFPRHGELVNQCRLEHASMEMARYAGMDVPETRLVDTSLGPVYLIERFDIDPAGHRTHMLSAQSLVDGYARSHEATPDTHSYGHLGRLAQQIGADDAAESREELFRRMLFNIAVGNRDDHMLNHSYLKPPGQKHYTLAPVYDVLPTIGHELSPQAIAVGPEGGRASQSNIMAGMEELGLDAQAGLAIAQSVLEATDDWEEFFRSHGLTDKELSIVGRSFSGRTQIVDLIGVLTEHEREQAAHLSPSLSR